MAICRELKVGDIIVDNDPWLHKNQVVRRLQIVQVGLTKSRGGRPDPAVSARQIGRNGDLYRPTTIAVRRIHPPRAKNLGPRRSGFTLEES